MFILSVCQSVVSSMRAVRWDIRIVHGDLDGVCRAEDARVPHGRAGAVDDGRGTETIGKGEDAERGCCTCRVVGKADE